MTMHCAPIYSATALWHTYCCKTMTNNRHRRCPGFLHRVQVCDQRILHCAVQPLRGSCAQPHNGQLEGCKILTNTPTSTHDRISQILHLALLDFLNHHCAVCYHHSNTNANISASSSKRPPHLPLQPLHPHTQSLHITLQTLRPLPQPLHRSPLAATDQTCCSYLLNKGSPTQPLHSFVTFTQSANVDLFILNKHSPCLEKRQMRESPHQQCRSQ